MRKRTLLIYMTLLVILVIVGISPRAKALPTSPYFEYIKVSNNALDYISSYGNYFVVVSGKQLYKVYSGNVEKLPYGKPFVYMRQVCSAPFLGLDGASVYVAGFNEIGIIVGKSGELSIWSFSAYSKPRTDSIGYDCKNNLLWAVDIRGNLYVASPSWDHILVLGPDGPKDTEIFKVIEKSFSKIAVTEALKRLKEMYPNAVSITITGYSPSDKIWVLGTGITYRVSSSMWYIDSKFIPLSSVAEFKFNAQITLSNNKVITLSDYPLNISAMMIVDLLSTKVNSVYTNVTGYVVTSLFFERDYGIMVSIVKKGPVSQLNILKLNETAVSRMFSVTTPYVVTLDDVVPVYDLNYRLPGMVINLGKDLAYYVARSDSEKWLVWSKEPFRGDDIRGVWNWRGYIVVTAKNKVNLLSLEDGTPLWAFFDGVYLEEEITSASSGMTLALGMQKGDLAIISRPVKLARVNVVVTVNSKPVGTGFKVIFELGINKIVSFTQKGLVTAYLPEGLWYVRGEDSIIGPLSVSVNVSKPVLNVELDYHIEDSYYVLLAGKDPLGFLNEKPALGAEAYLTTPWGSKVNLTVSSEGLLVVSNLPEYLKNIVKALPLRLTEKYFVYAHLKGYQNLSAVLSPGNGTLILKPILYKVTINLVDIYDFQPVPAKVVLSRGVHSATIQVNGVKTIWLPKGLYNVTITAKGYYTESSLINVTKSSLSYVYRLRRTLTNIMITILDSDFNVPVNAVVQLEGPVHELYYLAGGHGVLRVPWGAYVITASSPGYLNISKTVFLSPNENGNLILTLKPRTFYVFLKVRDYYNLSPIFFSVKVYVDVEGLGQVLYTEIQGKDLINVPIRTRNPIIIISAPGYKSYRLVPEPTKTLYTVLLKREEYNVSIVILDRETGNLTVSRVTLSGPISITLTGSIIHLRVPWGAYKLRVEAPGYNPVIAKVKVPTASPIALALEPIKHIVTVVVRDSYTGSPVNFSVLALPEKPYPSVIGEGFGKTSLKLRSDILYNLIISAKGYIPITSTINVTSNRIIYVDLLRKEILLRVTVRDADTGKPIPNVTVNVYSYTSGMNITKRTNSKGEVLVSVLWGIIDVKVKKANYMGFSSKIVITASNVTSTINVNIALLPIRYFVELDVLDAETYSSIPNVTVIIKNLELGTSFEVNTSRFMGYLRKGVYLVTVRAYGYASSSRTVNVTKDTKTYLYLRPLRRGVVIGASDADTGRSIPFTVQVFDTEGKLIYSASSNGRALNLSLRVGNYTLVVSNPLYMTYTTRLSVTPGNKPLQIIVRLREVRVPVKIVVTNEKGAIVNAYLEIKGANKTLKVMSNITLDLPVGYTYVIKAWAPGYLPSYKEVRIEKPGAILITLSSKRISSRLYLSVAIVISAIVAVGMFWSWKRRKEERELEEHLYRLIGGGQQPPTSS